MKLNGWVRLWVVLSVVWIIPVGYFAYSDIAWLLTKKRYEVSKEGVGQAEFLFSAEQSDSEIQLYISSQLTPLIDRDPQKYIGMTDGSPFDEYVTEHLPKKIRSHMVAILAPILGLLALGWSVAWIKRGFKNA